MKIIDEWRHVLLKAWSVRWLLLANVLGALPELVSGLDQYLTPQAMVRLMLIVNIGALVSRFIKQDNIKPGA